MALSQADEAWSQQYDQQQAQKQAQEQQRQSKQPPSLLQRFGQSVGQVTTNVIDTAVSEAEQWGTAAKRVGQDVASGAVTGGTNIADAAGSALSTSGRGLAMAEDPEHAAEAQSGVLPTSPIWDHAKSSIMDFRDAIAVQDPNLVDRLTQGAGQLVIPFAGYSRMLAWVHGFAKLVAAGALTDATALAPHDNRTADLIQLGRQTEGKLGAALQTLAPDGSALNAYINYLADKTNESEAEGRFKNVLDGFGANLIVTPLLASAATVLKQGQASLRYMAENGVRNTVSDMFTAGPPAGSPAAQSGKIGYHGTPSAPFTEFDNSRIGTGQGAQSFGYGHYIAENAETGEHYQKSLVAQQQRNPSLQLAQQAIKNANGDKVAAYKALDAQSKAAFDAHNKGDPNAIRLNGDLVRAKDMIKNGSADRGKGSLLKVDIDDKHIENMLDLDKPLEKQPEILNKIPFKDQKILQRVLDVHGQDLELGELTGNEFRQLVERAHNEDYLPLIGANDGNAARQASDYLSSRGIPGSKFFDRKSRVTGEGTRNYVVFDGKHIKVLGEGKEAPVAPVERRGAGRVPDDQYFTLLRKMHAGTLTDAEQKTLIRALNDTGKEKH